VARQNGITYLLDAASDIDRRAQLVLAASAPDTGDLVREVEEKVTRARSERGNVVLIDRMLTHVPAHDPGRGCSSFHRRTSRWAS
jgi:starch synthase